jgi:hypothetical protein
MPHGVMVRHIRKTGSEELGGHGFDLPLTQG